MVWQCCGLTIKRGKCLAKDYLKKWEAVGLQCFKYKYRFTQGTTLPAKQKRQNKQRKPKKQPTKCYKIYCGVEKFCVCG